MVQAQSLPLVVLSSVAFAGAVYHLVLFPWRREQREYFTFACVCAVAGLYGLCCAALYGVTDAEAGAEWQRRQMAVLALCDVAALWFMADFLRVRPVPRAVWILSVLCSILAAGIICGPLEWTISSIPHVREAGIGWLGLYAVYYEMGPGPGAHLLTTLSLATFAWVAWLLTQSHRHGTTARARQAWCMWGLVAVGTTNDVLMQTAGLRSVYMTEWSILGLLVVVAWSLSRELAGAVQLQVQLDGSERQAHSLFDASPVGVLLLDCPGGEVVRLADANPAAERMLGLNMRRDAGRTLDALLPDLADTDVKEQCCQVALTGSLWTGTHTSFEDGALRSALELHVFRARPGRAVMAVIDVSEQHRAALELRESRERYRTLALSSPIPILTVGDETVLFANAAAARALQWPRREDMLGLQLREVAHPDDLVRLRSYLDECSETWAEEPRGMDLRLRTSQGRPLEATLTASPTTYSQRPAFLVVFRDVTELRRASDQQAAMIQGLRTVVFMANELVESEDLDALLRRSVELPRERLGVVRCSVYLHEGGDKFRGTYGTDERGGTTDEHDVVYVGRAGEDVLADSGPDLPKWGYRHTMLTSLHEGQMADLAPGWVAWAPIGSPTGLLGAFYNDAGTTGTGVDPVQQELLAVYCSLLGGLIERMRLDQERSALEERWQQSQHLESLGVLAGGIAHDINNILGVMTGYAERALRSDRVDGEVGQNLEGILAAVRRARDVVVRVLAFSRKTDTAKELIRLDAVVEEAGRFHRAFLPAMVRVNVSVPGEPMLVYASETQIHQAVMNLCANAAQAMGEGDGLLEILLDSAEPDAREAQRLGLPGAGVYCRVRVRDSGAGMSEGVLQRAFEPYFTTKGPGGGTGLGLAAVHGIVTDHGGAVEIDSQPGHGTTVSIYLPRAHGEAPLPRARLSPVPGHGERVLTVDDEVELLALTTDVLAAGGYRVTPHADPLAAIAVLERDPQAFDALVTDQSMPGLTGIELARRARVVRPDLAVLLVTGYGHGLGDEDRVAASVDAVLSKPYGAEELLRALDQAITAAWTRRPR